MKNKGFMLIETLIASTIILGALIFLFVQFSSVKRGYENKKQKMYEYLEFKYSDDFGVEKRCRLYD